MGKASSVRVIRIKILELFKLINQGDEHLADLNYYLKNITILDETVIETLPLVSPIVISSNGNSKKVIAGLRTLSLLLRSDYQNKTINVLQIDADQQQQMTIEMISKYILPMSHSVEKGSIKYLSDMYLLLDEEKSNHLKQLIPGAKSKSSLCKALGIREGSSNNFESELKDD